MEEGKPVLQAEAKRQEDMSWYNKHAWYNLRDLSVKAAMDEARFLFWNPIWEEEIQNWLLQGQ